MEQFEMTVMCSWCGTRGVVRSDDLDDTLEENPDLTALVLGFLDSDGWIHDAAYGFVFCSFACAVAHGYTERPGDQAWFDPCTPASVSTDPPEGGR